MKKILALVLSVAAMLSVSSCKTVRHTSTTIPVETAISSTSTADLQVSQTRISYKLVPTNEMRRCGEKAVIATAVAEALQQNGNADVLVAFQYEIKKKRNKVLYVIVEGYPAKYVNVQAVK